MVKIAVQLFIITIFPLNAALTLVNNNRKVTHKWIFCGTWYPSGLEDIVPSQHNATQNLPGKGK
jgi:hypothetical protein